MASRERSMKIYCRNPYFLPCKKMREVDQYMDRVKNSYCKYVVTFLPFGSVKLKVNLSSLVISKYDKEVVTLNSLVYWSVTFIFMSRMCTDEFRGLDKSNFNEFTNCKV